MDLPEVFVRTIAESPYDDATRLIYADKRGRVHST
jgi:uncharacterized protein (TIGR02996 family)